jgi:ferrous iron transport protein A
MITGKDELRRHLEELGLTAGERVTVVSEIAGNMILLVRESRIAIAKTVASRIMI